MIIGKSATGKDLIYRRILEKKRGELTPVVMYTTRPMRQGETEGREYHFTDRAGLAAFREAGRVIEERVYPTVHGDWYYFTADDGQIDLSSRDYLLIGTLEVYRAMRKYFGGDRVVPLYIETDDGIRLGRAAAREAKQQHPAYAEVCRRYLADEEDFSEEKLAEAGIVRRFINDGRPELCIDEICEVIEAGLKETL